MLQPRRRRRSAWPWPSSMPSHTVSMPRSFARASTCSSAAARPLSSSLAERKLRSNLEHVDGHVPQKRKRRVPGAEVVHGDGEPATPKLAQNADERLVVRRERALGDLDVQEGRGEVEAPDEALEAFHEVVLQHGDAREVDGHVDGAAPGLRLRRQRIEPACPLEHAEVEVGDEPVAFELGDEPVGHQEPKVGGVPAAQRLDACERAVVQKELRLHVDGELAGGQGLPHAFLYVALERELRPEGIVVAGDQVGDRALLQHDRGVADGSGDVFAVVGQLVGAIAAHDAVGEGQGVVGPQPRGGLSRHLLHAVLVIAQQHDEMVGVYVPYSARRGRRPFRTAR